ncbi:hypothetical protein ONZ45_g8063 [Pleurotus djamor]|nr:hypothetical protein ONZ45_g14291 [Pleurotus djamor]KAJ8514406.1 hypothetical protein ONZ45_g8063 [Pleurotus djamor]
MALSSFSSCEISDALIKLGLETGGYIPDINMVSPAPPSATRICGPAYTVQMVLASDKAAPKLEKHFVDTIPEGSVIVINAPPNAKNAVWGGLMTAGAQSRSALGVVISGRCRDIQEHRAAQFPVFAGSHSTLGQSPFTRPSAINVPLTITAQYPVSVDIDTYRFPAVEVNPGDYIVGDEDGVVCVPKDLVDKVVEIATKGKEIDEKCMEDIKAGLGVQATFKKHRGKL